MTLYTREQSRGQGRKVLSQSMERQATPACKTKKDAFPAGGAGHAPTVCRGRDGAYLYEFNGLLHHGYRRAATERSDPFSPPPGQWRAQCLRATVRCRFQAPACDASNSPNYFHRPQQSSS
jgi:hypothetical protein